MPISSLPAIVAPAVPAVVKPVSALDVASINCSVIDAFVFKLPAKTTAAASPDVRTMYFSLVILNSFIFYVLCFSIINRTPREQSLYLVIGHVRALFGHAGLIVLHVKTGGVTGSTAVELRNDRGAPSRFRKPTRQGLAAGSRWSARVKGADHRVNERKALHPEWVPEAWSACHFVVSTAVLRIMRIAGSELTRVAALVIYAFA